MNVEELKEPLRVDKLLTLFIFPVESRILVHAIASACTRTKSCMRLFGER